MSLPFRMDLPHRMHPPLRAQDLRAKPGYYLQCFPQPGGFWRRHEPLPRPDARFGFPWTVKDWEKRQRKAGGYCRWFVGWFWREFPRSGVSWNGGIPNTIGFQLTKLVWFWMIWGFPDCRTPQLSAKFAMTRDLRGGTTLFPHLPGEGC